MLRVKLWEGSGRKPSRVLSAPLPVDAPLATALPHVELSRRSLAPSHPLNLRTHTHIKRERREREGESEGVSASESEE